MADSRRIAHTPPSASGSQQYADVLLNRYRIMNARGTGGFGTVLTCWDTRLQRRVAIKRLPLSGSGAAATLGEALREARTSSMLAHPNIVTVYDFEVEGSFAYLVMEYVDGLTLAELLKRVEGGILTHDEASCLVQSVASALGYAHENGVLHMDIKPTNIMIDRTGTVKLCDFGMASLASAAGYGGARGGTIGYMPPEQIEGDIVDERTDVFSLAVVVWQALLGESPFKAPTAEKSLALIRKGPGNPSKADSALAGMAEEALLGALAPDPASRIPSVETLAKELVFALGDPAVGLQSLRDLVIQSPERAQDDPEDWEGERLPLGISYPWLPTTFTRILTAGLTFYTALPLAASLLTQGRTIEWSAAAICAALAGVWPPLGAALIGAAACTAIIVHSSTTIAMLFAAALALSLLLWWAACGVRSDLSSLTMLLPIDLRSPLAGTAVAGTAFTPLAAAVTALVSWFIGSIWPTLQSAGFTLDGLGRSLVSQLASAPSLVSAAGCFLAALLCSTLSWHNGTVSRAVLGQTLGCIVLVGSQLLAERMENGGIWAEPSWGNTGIAVLLGVLVCIACILHGPRGAVLESED